MKASRRRLGRAGAADDLATEANSLFGEILDWMLAPLLFLWPITIIVTNHVAHNIADKPFDQAMGNTLRAVAGLVEQRSGKVTVNLPTPARMLLRTDHQDTVYLQVRDARGEVVAGDVELPAAALPAEGLPDTVYFRDEDVHGEEVRIAYLFLRALPGTSSHALVQLGETRAKRGELASHIIAGVLLSQFAVIPLAAMLVYLGLARGIAPLNRLQRLIKRRRPGDLSPISLRGIPEEVRPVVESFNDMMVRLEENLQAQRRFISDAAHQMRTPLTGLKLQTDLALDETDPDTLRGSLGMIAASTDRAIHLLNQLLSLARTEASSEKVHAPEVVDLSALVREVAAEMGPRALARGQDLALKLHDTPLLVQGYPILLREMLKNLVDNAIKYTPPAGAIVLRTAGGATALVEVEDTGIGISVEDRSRVFERFYRVLGTAAEGSGLGLAIVQEAVELNRGEIRILDTPTGKGSLFQAEFPRFRGQQRPEITPADAFPLA